MGRGSPISARLHIDSADQAIMAVPPETARLLGLLVMF